MRRAAGAFLEISFIALMLIVLWPQAARPSDRPPECPKRYCGCALSLDLFGAARPQLFLAANWLRFPKTAPAPGMVAARKGHVMKLIYHVNGSNWQVLDPNSGKGLTRVHVRSIIGFVVVNPYHRSVLGG